MINDFDFHCHTTVSDGTLEPHQLLEKAKNLGIDILAITDHDNIEGVQPAIEAGEKLGVEVIPGVEVSVEFEPGTMHICGYFIDVENKMLKNKLEYVQQARRDRNPKIIKKLNELGIDITMEEVEQVTDGGQIGRPNIAKVLINKGVVDNVKQAFTDYLAKGKPGYVSKERLKLSVAIEMIEEAGGIPILAHPVQLELPDKEDYIEEFKLLKSKGIIGVEAFSTHHNEEENRLYYKLAKDQDFLITGGSDFHGENKPTVNLGEFGEEVDVDVKEMLKFKGHKPYKSKIK